jgi:hypothetical protein
MITPDDAMRQAHMTADQYAYEASKAFERIFGFSPEDEPQAAAVFIGQYMRAAAHDYDVAMDVAMRERGK